MKRIYYLILFASLVILVNACKKDTTTALFTKTETLSMGAGYENDIYYRLNDGLTTIVPRTNWDIGFSVSPREAAVITNGAAGVTLKAYPTTDNWTWDSAIDTSGYSSWTSLYNSDTTWTEGAFNMNATDFPNYGWGDYDMITHNVNGVSLYIIQTRNGSFKKIWIEKKLSVDQKYLFRYANLDGSGEKDDTLSMAGKSNNFVYFSLETDEVVDREPDASTWDIILTKYIDNSIQYPVTGVLQNIGVTAIAETDAGVTADMIPSSGYLTDISTIGSDWKVIDMSTYQYSIDENKVYFIKDQNDNLFKIKFKTFDGSSTGNLSFDISTQR